MTSAEGTGPAPGHDDGPGASTHREGGCALDPSVTDEARTVRIQELQRRVAARDYVIDPLAVAEALLRRTDPRRDPVLLPPVIRRRADSPPAPAAPRRARRP
ncbi:hypothetical protein C7Y72_06290 [Paraconexibacter algicola]|uniref:Uncharacterized protein n=1 Tax=Paraconexibacter algicola TaxID=2133960 RepID=A0A2T4UJ71_9ACTN|nr:hypothetical protein C7Y72_06290 [Paraconexibacter algicola]